MTTDSELLIGRIYIHYKGGHYKLICLAELEADESPMAVYVDLHSERFWVRPVDEFREKFELLHKPGGRS